MGKHHNAILIDSKEIATDTFELTFKTENAKKPAIAGQFLHIKVPNRNELLLRRPISINTVDKASSTISIVVQAKGEGTQHLCSIAIDTEVDIIGPVGRGFMPDKSIKRAAVVGGGLGVAPLRYLIENNKKIMFDSYIGFRNNDFAYQTDIFEGISNMHLFSDDGSIGTKGFATSALDENLESVEYDAIYACGPTPMFRALKSVVEKTDIPCYISLEERMGCGIGACKTCVCKIKAKDDSYDHLTVCQDGPVFEIREVIL